MFPPVGAAFAVENSDNVSSESKAKIKWSMLPPPPLDFGMSLLLGNDVVLKVLSALSGVISSMIVSSVGIGSEELMDIGSGAVEMLLVGKSFPRRQMTFLIEAYAAGADTGTEMLQNDAEEGGYILAGQIELTVGEDVNLLEKGDSYYFDNNKPHRFRNTSDQECKIISATTPANF